jgi:hypothetical protein
LIFIVFHLLYLLLPLSFLLGPIFYVVLARDFRSKLITSILYVAYWFHVLTNRAHTTYGAPWKLAESNWLVRFIVEWLPVQILRTSQLDSSKIYVFACHPHGTLAFNRAAVGFSTSTLWDKAFPNIKFRVLTASAAFYVPFIREMWLWSYCVDASKKTAVKVLRDLKASVFVYPGGEKEQIETRYGEQRVFLSSRKGFIRLAIEEGAEVVPVYAFGETDLYHHSSFALDLRKYLVSRFGVAIPLLWGQYGLMPYRKNITLVFGSPLSVGHNLSPTAEEVDAAHRNYCKALLQLFDQHKAALGHGNATLEII